jgi:hypothetical protein
MSIAIRQTRCLSCFVEFHAQYGVDYCEYCVERGLQEKKQKAYCEHCGLIEIPQGDKYCTECTNDIIDYLAMEYQESMRVEKGLY